MAWLVNTRSLFPPPILCNRLAGKTIPGETPLPTTCHVLFRISLKQQQHIDSHMKAYDDCLQVITLPSCSWDSSLIAPITYLYDFTAILTLFFHTFFWLHRGYVETRRWLPSRSCWLPSSRRYKSSTPYAEATEGMHLISAQVKSLLLRPWRASRITIWSSHKTIYHQFRCF